MSSFNYSTTCVLSRLTVCNDDKTNLQMDLILSKCKDGEFSCNDGTCIDINKKCNIVNDCFDSSDEIMCSLLSMKDYGADYNPFMADISFGENDSIIPENINISMNLEKITGIKEIDIKFELKFNIFIDWFDKRLTWMHLLKNKS